MKPRRAERRRFAIASISAGVALLGFSAVLTARAQTIPNDAQAVALVPSGTFAGWFTSGTPTLNGAVGPADSENFSGTSLGAFWQWSWQMFLWVTSPAPSTYGGSGRVFGSSVFFDISPPGPKGKRHLIRHSSRGIPTFGVRIPQLGAHNLPVVLSKDHKVFEVVPTKKSRRGNPIITNGAGQKFEVSKITLDANKKPVFFDLRGKAIPRPKAPITRQDVLFTAPKLHRTVTLARTVQMFMIGGTPIFINPLGNIVDVEQGQAGTNGVLMSQGKSLVYYASMVNDVYAYFLTGTANGGITANSHNSVIVGGVPVFLFPTDAAGLGEVTTFASSHGVTLPDAKALAVELKTSWVEASSLPNASTYFTITARVPKYTQTSTLWTPTGKTKIVKLALVGMHVVGSTKGHPEMIWATFEHFKSTPNAPYTYLNTMGTPVPVAADTGAWTFCSAGATTFNTQRMKYVSASGNIQGLPNPMGGTFTIAPSDTNRVNPWGMDGSDAASNTQIISVDSSVLGQLIAGDKRANYFMTGATWTKGGAPPDGTNEVGTNAMANTTMETYVQGSNCFACHTSDSTTAATTAVSHMFDKLLPLFP